MEEDNEFALEKIHHLTLSIYNNMIGIVNFWGLLSDETAEIISGSDNGYPFEEDLAEITHRFGQWSIKIREEMYRLGVGLNG
jgi:hypothetical protein